MSKKLTPLDYFIALGQTCLMQSRNYKNNEVVVLKNGEKHTTKELGGIVETALKNYEEMINTPPIMCGRTHGYTQSIIEYICKNYKEVKITNLEDEDKVKAFEIIKEKGCLQFCMLGVDLEDYNKSVDITNKYEYQGFEYYKHYTQEEFDLLKEVFDND